MTRAPDQAVPEAWCQASWRHRVPSESGLGESPGVQSILACRPGGGAVLPPALPRDGPSVLDRRSSRESARGLRYVLVEEGYPNGLRRPGYEFDPGDGWGGSRVQARRKPLLSIPASLRPSGWVHRLPPSPMEKQRPALPMPSIHKSPGLPTPEKPLRVARLSGRGVREPDLPGSPGTGGRCRSRRPAEDEPATCRPTGDAHLHGDFEGCAWIRA